ncbi:hypothetical protein Tdes44962_MAKER04906 [Teratosphaeria destructans]|uniref:Uncharacterized protein n=1 Tax=Teratosphaeria destructans TaxID=418781 RepID=A0A9W7VZC6_9PEZI|nr:hypothetical protein Tdes44962_MAKER04906 [Teratosphaeria destructans]
MTVFAYASRQAHARIWKTIFHRPPADAQGLEKDVSVFHATLEIDKQQDVGTNFRLANNTDTIRNEFRLANEHDEYDPSRETSNPIISTFTNTPKARSTSGTMKNTFTITTRMRSDDITSSG